MKPFCKISLKDKKLAKKKAVRKWIKKVNEIMNSEQGRKLVMREMRKLAKKRGLI